MSVALTRQAVAELGRSRDPVADVLAMCEQGLAALVRAVSVLEAKDVLAAISILEHAVKVRDLNQEAVVAASTLRIRAERRVGELLAEQAARGERQTRGGDRRSTIKVVDADFDTAPTLKDLDITRDESSKFQRLASVPVQKFERAVDKVVQQATEKGIAVTREAVMREINPQAARTPSDAWKDGDRFKGACDRLADLTESTVDAIRWGHFPGPDAYDIEMAAITLSLRNAREAIEQVQQALKRQGHAR